MLGLAGIPLGLELRFLDPSPDAPARAVGELVVGAYDDPLSLRRLAHGADVVTYEFENVPVGSARFLAERVPVLPSPESLRFAQDRLLEKTLFEEIGLPVARFGPVANTEELEEALEVVGVPSVLKTRRLGYDGKGQVRLTSVDDAPDAWRSLGEVPCLLEALVPFDQELSILGVRGRDGSTAFYPLTENVHRDGILRTSRAPAASVDPGLQESAEARARALMERLDHVGVLAIELFEVDGGLLGNEFAPRVHNSGHWTIEGAATSQFENHLRAICGFELGPTTTPTHGAMVNLIGRMPDDAGFDGDGIYLHRYGKEARPGRKLGHVTIIAADRDTRDRVLQQVTLSADNVG